MPSNLHPLILGLEAIVILGLGALTIYVWRHHRSEHSARAFLGLLLALTFVALINAIGLSFGLYDPASETTWDNVFLSGIFLVQMAWGSFALKYTGRGDVLTRGRLVLLVCFSVLPLLSQFTNEHPVVSVFFIPWILAVFSALAVGLFLVFRSAIIAKRIPVRQATAIAIAPSSAFLFQAFATHPVVASVIPSEGSVILIGLFIGMLGLWVAVGRYRMFSSVPGVGYVGHEQIINQMNEGVVVVDRNGDIIDLNPVVEEAYDVIASEVVGHSVETVLGTAISPRGDTPTEIQTPDGRRQFAVSVSSITEGDREIGHTLVLRDVTDRKTREQRLQVLTRTLRHNLRNDLSVVQGYLEAARDEADDSVASLLSTAQETTDDLLSSAETARTVQTVLDDREVVRRELADVVETLLKRARETYPSATIEGSVPESVTVEVTTGLDDALWELLKNACEHSGEAPHVEVAATAAGKTAVLTIVDDGPGIPEHEQAVLEAGEETALEHGSGLGLWLAHWVITLSGGDLTFEVAEGTTVRVTLPLADTAN